MKRERPRWEQFCGGNSAYSSEQDLIFTSVLSPAMIESGKRLYKSDNYLNNCCTLPPIANQQARKPLSCQNSQDLSISSFPVQDESLFDPILPVTTDGTNLSNVSANQQLRLGLNETSSSYFQPFDHIFNQTSTERSVHSNSFNPFQIFSPQQNLTSRQSSDDNPSMKSSENEQSFHFEPENTDFTISNLTKTGLPVEFSNYSDLSSDHSSLTTFSTANETNFWCKDEFVFVHNF